MLTSDDLVGAALRRAWRRLPATIPRVVGMRYQLLLDATGANAVRVWVILDDATSSARRDHARLELIAGRIREEVRGGDTQIETDLIAYVYFRTKSEQESIDAGTYDAGEY